MSFPASSSKNIKNPMVFHHSGGLQGAPLPLNPHLPGARRARVYSLSFVLSLEAWNATSITLESVLSVIRRGALQAPEQACWVTLGTRRSSDTSKDVIFTRGHNHQNSENTKNTMVFHPPGLQRQFYHTPWGAPPPPPTLQAGPLKSWKTQGKLSFFLFLEDN